MGNNGEFPVCKVCGYVCENYSIGSQENHAVQHVKAVGFKKSTNYYFTRYSGCGATGCGDWVAASDKCPSQNLFIVDTTYTSTSTEIEVDLPVEFVPELKISIGKYNSYDTTTHKELTGAEFTVQAMQDGKLIYSKTGEGLNKAITIPAQNYSNVYIMVIETKAPNGYTKITTPLNIIMTISSDKRSWNASYATSQADWNKSGFDSTTWGNWTRVEDGDTSLPEDYVSANGDYINVSTTTLDGKIVMKYSPYNEPIINKLELLKIDSTDKKALAGAKFKASLSNVESITINGQVIKVNSESDTYELTTDANGSCVIDTVKLIDENKAVVITIEEVQVPASSTGDFYYKELSEPIVITVTHSPTGLDIDCSYNGIEGVTAVSKSDDKYSISLTVPNIREIDISGKVWLDEQTGIKPAVEANGNIDTSEQGIAGVIVKLYMKGAEEPIRTTVTDNNGEYKFEEVLYGESYDVRFEYDGINYEATIIGGDSKADENEAERTSFNNKFTTINYKEAVGTNGGKTELEYNYSDKKSTLITKNDIGTVLEKYKMIATTQEVSDGYMTLTKTTSDINLGLVKRGTDIALSTDVYDAKVTINGQATDYTFNKEDNSLEIGTTQTSEKVSYNLNLYTSDYNYRVRDYVNTQDFQEKDYMNDGNPGILTGDDLRVRVIYELNIQNQSTETTRINEVKYDYDEKYTFVGLQDSSYGTQDLGDAVTVNLNGLSLSEGETKTIYLVFEVKETSDAVNLGEFTNKAEITSYSTEEGLIDVDSQPGNFVNDAQVEDDSDTAGGLTITVPSNLTRIINGKVFDEDGDNVNDVIVQLIELKTVNEKVYEYIWQETVSGTDNGLRLNADGTALETYSYDKTDGYYEFKGFIPGDYIVRFIYGDGTTYDMTGNVIKYNGQDYKSMPDSNYKAEWYNTSSYATGASVARDNEARRLETMAYSVEVNAVKGVLLKLLNNVTPDTLNETEKEVLIATYNYYYDPDITAVTQENIDKLLKEVVLENTWMCAETSKIKVPVDTENINNTSVTTTVNGINTTYTNNITNINFGLELRPVTQIELEKYITGFKLIAANGQTLVNAYIDVNEYLNGTTDISNKVQGVKDNVTILSNVWQYEVVQTDINTIVDGSSLEFEYTLVVKNTGEDDYLSTELANAYNTSSIGEYKELLADKASDLKAAMRSGTYRTQIGNSVGTSYYTGGLGTEKVLTEVTNIRDYVNNDLTFVFEYSGKVDIDESASHTHRLLREDWSMQEATINTILKTTEPTGKMSSTDNAVMYTVTLGKNPISSTGNLSFDTYIAEVMSYTNAVGRRAMTSTPGNAEIVDAEQRTGKSHEIDEADTGRIQVGVATGDDQKTNYIIIIAVAVGIALVAVGAFVVKKYVIK